MNPHQVKNGPSVLFLCRRRTDYGISVGLFNSARMVAEALTQNGIPARVEWAVDGNDIDRLVHQHQPTHVIIEAIWVTPSKFRELILLPRHSHRHWMVRIHSELAFLAHEGMAVQWLRDYISLGVDVSANSRRTADTLNAARLPFKYLPNVYIESFYNHLDRGPIVHKHGIDIGCFGAIRPLKNHLNQAVAAIVFANKLGRSMRFHVNLRTEQSGDAVLRNLRAMIQPPHALIEVPWMERGPFLSYCRAMDIGLQVSISETFNIVAADLIASDVPVVGSEEIVWLPKWTQAEPFDVDNIVDRMNSVSEHRSAAVAQSRRNLAHWNADALKEWNRLLLGRC